MKVLDTDPLSVARQDVSLHLVAQVYRRDRTCLVKVEIHPLRRDKVVDHLVGKEGEHVEEQAVTTCASSFFEPCVVFLDVERRKSALYL